MPSAFCYKICVFCNKAAAAFCNKILQCFVKKKLSRFLNLLSFLSKLRIYDYMTIRFYVYLFLSFFNPWYPLVFGPCLMSSVCFAYVQCKYITIYVH